MEVDLYEAGGSKLRRVLSKLNYTGNAITASFLEMGQPRKVLERVLAKGGSKLHTPRMTTIATRAT